MMVCVCVLDTGVSQNANLPARLFRREWEIALCGAGWGGTDFPLLAPRVVKGQRGARRSADAPPTPSSLRFKKGGDTTLPNQLFVTQ